MKKKVEINLYVPSVEDLWFRQVCNQNPKTMSYNAGYNLEISGYHFETGCIDFPKSAWQDWYENKIKNSNIFYAYIQDAKTKDFVGHVNFKKDSQTSNASVGIVIKDEFRGKGYMRPAMQKLIAEAKRQGVAALLDTVPKSRVNALKVFYDLGFKKIGEFKQPKFGSEELVAEIKLEL